MRGHDSPYNCAVNGSLGHVTVRIEPAGQLGNWLWQAAFGIALALRYGAKLGRISRADAPFLERKEVDRLGLWRSLNKSALPGPGDAATQLLPRCAFGAPVCSSQPGQRGCCQCCGACGNQAVRPRCTAWQEWPEESGLSLCPLLRNAAVAQQTPSVLSLQGFFRT